MGFLNLPSLDDVEQEKDPKKQVSMLINTVGLLMKQLTEINGYLQSKNIKEVGGYFVSDTDLKSKDGDVGLSSANDAADPVRMWAGSASKDTAPWRVTKAGKMNATGATIQSASGFPKVIIDPSGNLIAAYSSPTDYIAFVPQGYGSVPSVSLVSGGQLVGFLNRSVGGTTLGTFNSEMLTLQGSGIINIAPTSALQIGGTSGYSGTISYVKNVVSGNPTFGTITVTKGIITNVT